MNSRQYLLLVFALANVTVAARPWGLKVASVVRGGSDQVESEEEEYSDEESEVHWDSEDNLSDMEDLGSLAREEESEEAETEAEEVLQESEDDVAEPEIDEEHATEPEMDETIRSDADDNTDQTSTEPDPIEDNRGMIDDNVQDDPSLVEDDSSANVDTMDLADAYDEDIEPEPIAAPIPVPTVVDDAMRRKLVKDLKYRRREVQFMKPEIAALVAQKELPRPVEGVPPHWLVSQPRSGVLRKVVAVSLTVIAIAVASQKVDVMNVDLSDLWKRPSPVSSSDPFDLFELTEELVDEPKEEIKQVNEHVNALGDVHPHSVKPGQPSVQDELDVTWLDKLITCIERKVQAFFRMKL